MSSDGDEPDEAAQRAYVRRRYTVPPVDDPLREADLGAVLQAVTAGSLHRDEIGRRVGAAEWAPGRLDDVVDHGIATGVLREDGAGVRARYTD